MPFFCKVSDSFVLCPRVFILSTSFRLRRKYVFQHFKGNFQKSSLICPSRNELDCCCLLFALLSPLKQDLSVQMKYSIQTQDVKLLPSILESNLHTDLYVIYASDFTEIKHKRPVLGYYKSFTCYYIQGNWSFSTFPFIYRLLQR